MYSFFCAVIWLHPNEPSFRDTNMRNTFYLCATLNVKPCRSGVCTFVSLNSGSDSYSTKENDNIYFPSMLLTENIPMERRWYCQGAAVNGCSWTAALLAIYLLCNANPKNIDLYRSLTSSLFISCLSVYHFR